MRVLLLPFILAVCCPAQEQQVLNYSIVGSSSCKTTPCFDRALANPRAERPLLDLARNGPRASAGIAAALSGSGVRPEDLEALGLVRAEGDRRVLNFTLFTAEDIRRIRKVTAGYARSLADEFVKRRSAIDRALAGYNLPGADRGAASFIILGCFSLDWDGLNITATRRYLTRQRIYWGSHNNSWAEVAFTSFGDHHSVPRTALPDAAYGRLLKMKWDFELPSAIQRGDTDTAAAHMGRLMMTLREGPQSLNDLARKTRIEPAEAARYLSVLKTLEYVADPEGLYSAKAMVFTQRDLPMVHELKRIGRQVMEPWLAANYSKLRGELGDTAPSRWGVPYEEGFTMIWHFVFGPTNQLLVEAGMFSDPYAPERRYQGFIPAVFPAKFN